MKIYRAIASVFAILLLSGCASNSVSKKSSVVDYLYPESEITVEPSTPSLELPIKLGIAFVPESGQSSGFRNNFTGRSQEISLTEADKTELLEKVAADFRKIDFINSIEIIPSAYLTPQGGFSNLSQIKTMYGIDVIALVSYDQVQFTDNGLLSLSYWTIIGAYIVSGEKNDTATLLDTVVYDIDSRKLLFRAPGTSRIQGSSTPINLSEELRNDSKEGFNKASDIMVVNLKKELERFKEKIKSGSTQAKVTYREGYGGGSIGFPSLFLLSLLVLIAYRKRL